jgi:nucleoside-diphosphate-sugar epimerase
VKTALCTGSAGFVGRALVPELLKQGYNTVCVDPLGRSNLWRRREWTFERWRTSGAVRAFDLVIHLAANILDVDARSKQGIEAFADMELDLAMARYIEAYPPRRMFVAMSSCAIDTWATDPYSYTKLTLEQFSRKLYQRGVPVTVLRPYSGYGPGQALSYPMPAIIDRAIKREDPLTVWGTGRQIRDWLYIDDLVRAIMMAVEGKFPQGQPIDIGSGTGTDFLALAKMIAHEVGYDPVIAAQVNKAESSPRRIANTSVATAHGFTTQVSLEEGIRRCVQAAIGKPA